MRKKQPQATKAPQAKFGGTFPLALYERLTAEAARENRSIVGSYATSWRRTLPPRTRAEA